MRVLATTVRPFCPERADYNTAGRLPCYAACLFSCAAGTLDPLGIKLFFISTVPAAFGGSSGLMRADSFLPKGPGTHPGRGAATSMVDRRRSAGRCIHCDSRARHRVRTLEFLVKQAFSPAPLTFRPNDIGKTRQIKHVPQHLQTEFSAIAPFRAYKARTYPSNPPTAASHAFRPAPETLRIPRPRA